MNKRLAGGFMMILAGLFILPPPAPAAGAGTPKIKFKETAWNFGKIKQGDVATHEFVFANEGDDTLTIEKVSTTCGCTAALVSDRSIPPGKSGKIEVKFDSRGYGGQITKVVTVQSNDPKDPQRPLEIKAEIEIPPSAKIEIDPYNYDAGLMVEGDELLADLKIMNRGELELRVEFNHRSAAYASPASRRPCRSRSPRARTPASSSASRRRTGRARSANTSSSSPTTRCARRCRSTSAAISSPRSSSGSSSASTRTSFAETAV